MAIKYFSLVSFLLISLFAFSQTPCENGFSGEYPCNGYDLISHISLTNLSSESGIEGSDVWGWTDPETNKEYAIVGLTNSTVFVDISSPVTPIVLGGINSNAGNNYWRDIKVYNNYAFIVADNVGAHGIQIFDLTRLRNVGNPPENFTADTVFTSGFNGSVIGSCHNIAINETTAIAYLVGCSSANNGGSMAIDISDPLNPVAVGEYTADGYSHDAQAITYNGPDSDYSGKEILLTLNGSKIVFLDVTDPANMIKISEISYPNASYIHQGWFLENHQFVLVGDEGDEQDFGTNTRTNIIDVSDLDNPTYHSFYEGQNKAIDHNLYIKESIVYQSNYTSGLRVLDISNINSITEIGFFDTFPSNNNTTFNGSWSIYPYFFSENIIISDIERGLFIVRKNETLSVNNISTKYSFSISPNPTNSNPVIRGVKNNYIKSVEVFNILGKKIFTNKNINQIEYTIPLKGYPKGIYFIKINSQTVKKLILKK